MAVIYPAWDVTLHWVQQVSIGVYPFTSSPDEPSSQGCFILNAACDSLHLTCLEIIVVVMIVCHLKKKNIS